jgi:hypothetical protein
MLHYHSAFLPITPEHYYRVVAGKKCKRLTPKNKKANQGGPQTPKIPKNSILEILHTGGPSRTPQEILNLSKGGFQIF